MLKCLGKRKISKLLQYPDVKSFNLSNFPDIFFISAQVSKPEKKTTDHYLHISKTERLLFQTESVTIMRKS